MMKMIGDDDECYEVEGWILWSIDKSEIMRVTLKMDFWRVMMSWEDRNRESDECVNWLGFERMILGVPNELLDLDL